jgi:predicted peptidase
MIYQIKQLYPVKYLDGSFTGTNFTYRRLGHSIQIADEFIPKTYTSSRVTKTIKVNGQEKRINSIGYSLYSPPSPKAGEKYPLVVYLHGSSCRSIYESNDDRMTPVYTNQGGITWVKNGTKDTYVFVPQYETDTFDLVKEAFLSIVNDSSLSIDRNRIYVAGLSMGGLSSWEMLLDPDLGGYFAAALISCGFPLEKYPDMSATGPLSPQMAARVKSVADRGVKIWLHHSDIDPTVPVIGSRQSYRALLGQSLDAAINPVSRTSEASYYSSPNGNIRYKEVHFVAGQRNVNLNMYSVSPHEVYENTYTNPEYIQWVFAQHK